MKKISLCKVTVLCLSLALCVLLTACGGTRLFEGFDEETIKTKVTDIIGYINSRDSEKILETSTDEMKKALTEEAFKEIFDGIAEGGAFQEISSITMSGFKDKAEEKYALVIVKAKYEKKVFTYTISLTQEMKLAGLYYK